MAMANNPSRLGTMVAFKFETDPFNSFKIYVADTILRFLVEWNTNSKNCHVAQTGKVDLTVINMKFSATECNDPPKDMP